MILPDVNLLVYAIDHDSSFHPSANEWLEEVLARDVGFTWSVLLGFIRITTRARIVRNPLTGDQALDLIATWLSQPNARIVHAGPRHFEILRGLLTTVGTAGNLTTDAHLAAVALEYGWEVHSTDDDFRQFPGLRWRNPLVNRKLN